MRAAAPVLENARQALMNSQNGPAGHAGLVYDLRVNVRAYLALSDSLPKPSPFLTSTSSSRNCVRRRNAWKVIFAPRSNRRNGSFACPTGTISTASRRRRFFTKPAVNEKRIVFLGDSITDGWRLNEYFPNRDFVNRGISGQITGEMLGRMKADVIDLKPTGVIILAGTNDLARGVPLATIENIPTMIADLADYYKIKPIFSSVLPVSDYHKDVNPYYEMSKVRPPSQIIELNRWIEAFCKMRRYPYLDYFSKMVDQAGYMRPELADDGLHPNSAGYRVMGPLAVETIDKMVGRSAAPLPPAPVIITSKKPAPKPPAAVPVPVTSANPPAPKTGPRHFGQPAGVKTGSQAEAGGPGVKRAQTGAQTKSSAKACSSRGRRPTCQVAKPQPKPAEADQTANLCDRPESRLPRRKRSHSGSEPIRTPPPKNSSSN